MELSLLLIEDEPEFADYLRRGLMYEGYRVQLASSAEAALEQLRRGVPDALLLDVMLPGMDGMAACRRFRAAGYGGPLLMLTARDGVHDRISGLDAGADDYLVKPFVFDELLARLRALLRRARPAATLCFADLELDTAQRVARRRNRSIDLSQREYELLQLFLTHPRQTLPRASLLEEVWGDASDRGDNVLDVYIFRLRRKLGERPLIHTVHGVGYVLREDVT